MPPAARRIVVLVHGWSVYRTDTYGELHGALTQAADQAGLDIDVKNIWLSKYVSFRDEVRVEDIARGFELAVATDLRPQLKPGQRFTCITHSTGGPVVRDWVQRYYAARGKLGDCPMSHLIMLAPANFGSALAQLGKSRLSRISAWFKDVEPGAGVLDWLELGSPEAWQLNTGMFDAPDPVDAARPIFPFVLTGQSIDRKAYDHVNAYTGEVGSDGVVRVAAANLNSTYLKLEQKVSVKDGKYVGTFAAPRARRMHSTAFAIVPGRAHSGDTKGILRSIRADDPDHPTVSRILRCMLVRDRPGYDRLSRQFDAENRQTIAEERVEPAEALLRPDHVEIHDRQSMLIFRVTDDQGHVIENFDLLLTANDDDPNKLPVGFLTDRQGNKRHKGTVTFFINYDLMAGSEELRHPKKKSVVRKATVGVEELGFRITPHQEKADLFVRYVGSTVKATKKQLESLLRPNETTLIDVVLRRIVGRGVFRLTNDPSPDVDWRTDPPGDACD